VEREEHCCRCKGGVPGVTSPGITDQKFPRTDWQSITVEGCGLLCVAATTLCVIERDNREVQETLASEKQYNQGTQLGTSKEQEVVQAEAGQGDSEKQRVLQKGHQELRPATKLLSLIVGRNPKSNKPCAKIAARKKCAGPCAFLH